MGDKDALELGVIDKQKLDTLKNNKQELDLITLMLILRI